MIAVASRVGHQPLTTFARHAVWLVPNRLCEPGLSSQLSESPSANYERMKKTGECLEDSRTRSEGNSESSSRLTGEPPIRRCEPISIELVVDGLFAIAVRCVREPARAVARCPSVQTRFQSHPRRDGLYLCVRVW